MLATAVGVLDNNNTCGQCKRKDVRAYLHIEQGSELRSQAVT